MLTFVRKHPWLTGLACIAVAITALFVASFFVQVVREICEKNEYTGAKECAAHHLGPYSLFWIVHIIDEHNGFVTALGTLAVAAFTLTLWRTSYQQAVLTRQSIDLARQEFISTHRPRLRIRNVAPPSQVSNGTAEFRVVVWNVGETNALLVNDWFSVFEVRGGVEDNYAIKEPTLTASRGGGVTEDILIKSGDYHTLEYETLSAWNPGDDVPIVITGYISYLDEAGKFGAKRSTGYARDYNAITDRMSPSLRYAHAEFED
ncbi:MAG TPA: hypothetical protein VHU18_10640 [Rhizomicrobium sp.]|jgi:hypothetical protein|nr:hypothetical protein [Rhizomicrobium sp.]